MLSRVIIRDIRGLLARTLGAGLVQIGEVPALARALGALDAEEQLVIEAEQKAAEAAEAAQKKIDEEPEE